MPVDARKDSMREQKEKAQKDTSKDTGWRSPLSPERVKEIHSKKTRERAANKKDVTKTLPPALNPIKYSPNPTPSYPATPENITTLITENLPIVGNVIRATKTLTDEEYDPLNPYSDPQGPVPGASYDPSQLGEDGQMGVEPTSPGPDKKKKKTPKPGFTLLEGAGGTLLGS